VTNESNDFSNYHFESDLLDNHPCPLCLHLVPFDTLFELNRHRREWHEGRLNRTGHPVDSCKAEESA